MPRKNPKISKRALSARFSPIRKFVPFLQKIKQKGTSVFELHIGQPDLDTPSEVLQTIKGLKEKSLRYTPSVGIPETRNAWQKYYRDSGMMFDISEIIVTTGGSEAILFAFAAICDPRDEIIVFEPFFTGYNGFASIGQVNLVPLRTSIKNGFHLPSKERIKRRITKKTRGILICNPNNPTGTIYTKQELEMIVEIARKYNLFILSDEVYREFVYDNEKHYSIMNFPRVRSRAILLDSVSKRFSACGARIGCLVSKNKDIIKAVTKFTQARLSSPMIEQLAMTPVLKKSKRYTKKIVREYKKRRDVAFKSLQEIPDAEFSKPKGAFYIIVKLPIKDSEHFTKWLLTDFSYRNQTVMVAPAAGFYATHGLGKNEIRIAFILSSPKIKKAIRILKIGLERYKQLKFLNKK